MSQTIPPEIIEAANVLALHSEILPNGNNGLIHKLQEAYNEKRPLRVKLGVDPTSSDLHLGHTVCLNKLKRFQELGHQVVLIIGGFTAQIGDPSGRNATRPALTLDQVNEYAKTYLDQVSLILDIDKTEIVNNADWLSPLSLNEILKLASKITLNQLLAKEAFGDRLAKEQPLAFHELFYPLLQAYDSVAIRADIELGGSDQRFNILQGRELQAKLGLNQQIAMLLPLIEGTCGKQKMSKTYDNYIALKHTPNEMFSRTMRLNDDLIIKYFELTTALSNNEIQQQVQFMLNGGNPAQVKKILACELVKTYHGQVAADIALNEWNNIHSFKALPTKLEEYTLNEDTTISKLLVKTNLASSGSEAKRLIQEGAVKFNSEAIKDINFVFNTTILNNDENILQIGRRKFLKLIK